MSKKSLRTVSGLTLAVALVQTVQPVLADESANSNSVVVKSEKLDAVAKEAAGLGFTTTTTKETRVAKTREEFERLKSEAKAELDELASTIQRNVDADKQHKVKVKEAVDKVKDEEETIKAQYPLLAEKDGVRVYGKFNEAKKGSQAYYENIHAFTDREDITPLKDGLYVRQDSEITAEEGSTIHTPLDYYGRTFLGVEGKSPVGTKIKVSHVGDTLDGKRVDAHVELVALSTYFTSVDGFKKFLDSNGSTGVTLDDVITNVTSGRGFTQSAVSLDKKNGILNIHAFDAGGHTYKITYKTEDGTTINPMSALVNVDIDYGQGIAVSEKNLITGILSPESELTTGDIRDTMGAGPYKKAQYDAKYIGADSEKSIPKGSGIFITVGGEFEYSHFNASTGANGFNLVEHTDNRNRTKRDISMLAGLFAKDVKVKLHTPEIPTAPAIEKDFELKEIEVSLKEETTVEPTTTTTTTEAPKPETPVEKPTETTTTTEAPTPENPVVEVKPTETTTTTEAPKPETPVEKPTETTTTTEAPKPEEPVEKPTETTTTTEAPKPETPIEVEKPTTTTEAPKPETPKPVEPITTYVDENGKQLLPPEKGEKDKKDIPGYKFIETKKKENGDTEHVYKKISNITTYVDENGKELLPKEDGIVDKKEIPAYEYVRTNKKENGDVEHVYRQVKNVTTYVDVNGKVLLPPKEGIHEKETIDGYEFVRTDKKPNGDVEHVYRKSITTTYVDENGKQLSPPEKGEKDKKDIPGYKFVETKKKENGDTEHVYKKNSNITTYVDESGKELLPKEDGIVDKKEIPGYEYVRTDKKENGDVEHVYKKVSKITTYVDENGKSLLPPEEGEKDKKDIPGYEFVETKKKENGDIEHVYKKVSKITTYVDENGKELLKPKEGTHDKEVIDGYEFVRTVNKPNGDIEHVYKKKSTEKKLPATGGGIAGAIAALAGLTGVGAYFSKKKKK
jgi:surface repeat SSSPR-51 protein